MGHVRRVTLRCLCEDLTEDWEDVAEKRAFQQLRRTLASDGRDSGVAEVLEDVPTTARAAHPLVGGFFAAFESDSTAVLRESISGLTDPHWWKERVGRWRGAATDASHAGDGEAWLCAGGLRAGGDQRDFYKAFMAEVQGRGPDSFLPAQEDRRLQEVEAKVARRDAWIDQVRLSVLVCISEADRTGGDVLLHVPAPGSAAIEDALAHLTFTVHHEGDGTDELLEFFMHVSNQDHARSNLVRMVIDHAQAVVEPVVDAWRVLPGAGADQIWSTLISSETLQAAHGARAAGETPAHLRGTHLKLGVQAHYTRKDGIVSAAVEGDPVRGLCGRWFVPTANPESLPVCAVCEEKHSSLAYSK